MKLTEKDWQTLSGLLDDALDVPLEARAAWVEGLTDSYTRLKPILRKLLVGAASSGIEDFLATLAKLNGPLEGAVPAVSFHEGAAIGPYRLLRELGAGGMGVVWLAERSDGALEREVALKLPLVSVHQTALAERFVRERDILARLTHPNIARLYDAGVTATGQPYLALEYVEGEPLIAHCDRTRLDIRRRIDLFLQVLAAVQYAHRNLVVHRDLKPPNILVTAESQVRLLDFGIAKLLLQGEAKETELTQVGGRALTPGYASPEQILGEPVTTASDVYSLGVVLYELTVGSGPYRLKRSSRAELEEAILTVDPVRPSNAAISDMQADARATTAKRLRRFLSGELDAIVGKALRKDPAERYITADAFAQDLVRFLAGEPVSARPDRRIYRLRKFLARNRLAVGAASLTALVMVAATTISVREAQVAQREATTARAVQDFLLDIFSTNTDAQADPLKARETTARQLLDIGARRVSHGLQASPEAQEAVLDTLASMYFELGLDEDAATMQLQRVGVLKRSYGAKHPKVADALLDYSKDVSATTQQAQVIPALEEARAILDDAKDFSSLTRGKLLLALARGYMYVSIGAMRANADQAARFYRQHYPADDDVTAALFYAGRARSIVGECQEAASLYRQSLGEAEKRAPRVFSTAIADMIWLGDAEAMCGDIAAAEGHLRRAAASSHEKNGATHINTLFADAALAGFLHWTGRRDEAQHLFSELQEMLKSGAIHAPGLIAQIQKVLSKSFMREGRLEEASEIIEQRIHADEKLYPASTMLAEDLLTQAELATARGHYVETDALLARAIDTWRTAVGPAATSPATDDFYLARMRLLLAEGDAAGAHAARQMIAVPNARALRRPDGTRAEILSAEAYLQQGRISEAVKLASTAFERVQQLAARGSYPTLEADAALALGRAEMKADNLGAARAHLQRAVELRQRTDDEASPWLADAEIALGDCLAALGERTRAESLLEQAKAIHSVHRQLGEHLKQPLRELQRHLAQKR